MEISVYNRQALKSFIESDFYYQLINVPISKHRALSLIHNPRTSDDDILLIVAYENNKTIGLIGNMPDYTIHEDEKKKINWLTCFWVDNQYKSENVAANIFLRMVRACNQDIIMADMEPHLEKIYQKTKLFKPTIYSEGIRCYLRFDLRNLMPPKNKFLEKMKLLLTIIDMGMNISNDFRLLFLRKKISPPINIEYLNQFDEACSKYVMAMNTNELCKKGKDEISWILSYPWILQGTTSDFNSKRYYFSSLSKRFFHQIIKFTNHNNDIVGIVVLCVRNNTLKVPFYYTSDDYNETIGKFIFNKMIELKISTIITFNKNLISYLKGASGFIYKKKAIMPYLISKKLEHINNLAFQDGDNDFCFC